MVCSSEMHPHPASQPHVFIRIHCFPPSGLLPDLKQRYDFLESTTPSLDVRGCCDPPLSITQPLRGRIRCLSCMTFVLQMHSCLLVFLAAACFSSGDVKDAKVKTPLTFLTLSCSSPVVFQPCRPASGCRHR